jgi:hypothetical protein
VPGVTTASRSGALVRALDAGRRTNLERRHSLGMRLSTGHHFYTLQGQPLSFGPRIHPTHHMSTRLQQSRGQLLWCSSRRRKLIRLGLYQAPCSNSGLLPTSMKLAKPANAAREPTAASASPHKPIGMEGFRSQASLSPRLCLPLRNALLDRTPTPHG